MLILFVSFTLASLAVEAQNLVLDERYAAGNVERLSSLTQELILRNPDVLLVSTTPGNLAAKAATSTIPIVMVLVADPVGAGIVPNLAQRGEADESRRIILVTRFAWIVSPGGDRRVVEAHRRFAASAKDVAFVKLDAHGAGDVLLALGYEGL